MRILVTNDDSITSKGLWGLAEKAVNYGEVFVVAPLKEQSGKSHSINIHDGFQLSQYDSKSGMEAYTVSSTPADCVRSAYYALKKDFDIVFSGINNGLNIGEDISYSGTIAAISEGNMLGKKGIAFSSYPNNYMAVIENFAVIMDFFKNNNLLELNDIYNVNVPNNPKGIKITKQGKTHFDTRFDNIDGMLYQKGNPRHELDNDNKYSDVRAIYNNYISITPLINDRTNYDVLNKIKKQS